MAGGRLRGGGRGDHMAGMDADTPDLEFTDAELSRYSRHILLAEVGAIGQAKLRAAAGQRPAQAAGIGHPGLAAAHAPAKAPAPAEPRRARRDGLTTPAKPRLNRPDAVAGTWRAVAPSSR